MPQPASGRANFGSSWLVLCFAMGIHLGDEAAHNFLAYYNATALTLWSHFSGFPRLDTTPTIWLGSMIGLTVVLLAVTPLAFRNARWLRPVAYVLAACQIFNALSSIVFSVRGHSVPSVAYEGAAPGAYTAPLLIAAALYLVWSLRRSSPTRP